MEELIKITEHNGKQAVSARELHTFLESKRDFSNWIKDRIEKYGLIENQDFVRFNKNVETTGGRLIEYALTIDCAKELSMVEGNAKGKQARQYFIERDKELRKIEQGELIQSRYDASRNILPGVFSPKTKMIANQAIWTILFNDIMYYRLKEVLLAAGIYEQKRKDTSEAWFKPYVYWMNDQTGEKPKRYVTEDGILIILSKTRVMENPKFTLFLNSFTSNNEVMEELTSDNHSELQKFMDIIINTQDQDSRKFLYNLYKKLAKNSNKSK